MAKKLRDFLVTLYPAEYDRGYFVTKFQFGQDLPQQSFQAATTDAAIAVAEAFAMEHGDPCQASIRITQGRKPAGFDARTKSLYYNMDLPKAS